MAIALLGRFWISQSRVILDLFVPNVPLDPAVMLQHSKEQLEEQVRHLTDQITLHSHLELRMSGNKTNLVIQYLSTSLRRLTDSRKFPPRVLPRNDVQALGSFWLEVAQFMKQVIDYSKIDDLALALDSNDASALARENVVQESISGFTRRLINIYPEFDDLVHILRLALAELKLGLRMVRLASEHRCSPITGHTLAPSLVAFPPVRSACLLQSHTPSGGGLNVSEHLLLTMDAVAYYHQSSGLPLSMTIVQTVYEQAYRLWSIDRTRKQEREQDLGDVYQRTTTAQDLDSRAATEEFLELFPIYEDALSLTANSVSDNKNMNNVLHHLSPLHHRRLFSLHLVLMGENQQNRCAFDMIRRSALQSLLPNHLMSLPDSLDKDALHEQIAALREHLEVISGVSDPMMSPSNFYSAANVPEARKALGVVQSLRSRLVSLLQEWPDQMVLQHLLSRCDIILSFDFTSPVAKLLSALEQLLMQTEDWEMYACRENSLKSHQRVLTDLIIEWRRLELSHWKGLLESECRMFTDAVSEHWFNLYELLVRGPVSAVAEDPRLGLSKYVQQLPSLLDDFIRTSSLGQFQARLTLLKSFETFISGSTTTVSIENSAMLHPVCRIVHFTWRSFHLFLPQVSHSLNEQRRFLEKEVEALIKLASWKDVNVRILQQSARKSHHQLYKIIRKFRDVLRTPVTASFTSLFIDTGETAGQAEQHDIPPKLVLPVTVNFPDSPARSATASSHFRDLQRTFEKFHTYIDKSIRQVFLQYTPRSVSELSSNIIMMAQDLADETTPRDLSKEKREKYKKNLLTRRKKAWSDLQKDLKRGGLTYRVKPEITSQLEDDSWIRDQPLLPDNERMILEKGECYFDRLRGCLPILRSALLDHHSDLSARDLSRGISLIESGCFLALETRAVYVIPCSTTANLTGHHRLCQNLSSFSVIHRQISRLQAISEATAIVHIETPEQLNSLRSALCISARSLEELVSAIRAFPQSQDSPAVMDLAQEVQALGSLICSSRDYVFQILEKSRVIMPGVLLHGEPYAFI